MVERANPEDPGFKDKWFGLIRNKYKLKLYERYRFCNKYIKGKKILDIPCGVGWGTSLLKGATFIFGIDISEEAINYAKKHYETMRRKFYVGNMQDIFLKDNSIDVVICLEGLEHVPKDVGSRFLKESKRILKRDCILIITCPVLNKKGETSKNPYHLSEYPEYELIDIFNKNFRILSLERIEGPDGPEIRAVVSNFKGERYIK